MSQQPAKIEQDFIDLPTTISKIEAGESLVIAADESFLSKLPKGSWIAGTIPYFIGHEGGINTCDMAFVNTIKGSNSVQIKSYDANTIDQIAIDAPENGFTIAILPAGSNVHSVYAKNAPNFDSMFETPIIGWISGSNVDEMATAIPKTIHGPNLNSYSNSAVVLHIEIPDFQVATINIINTFEKGSGPVLTFPETGFNIDTCFVDGVETNFATYIRDNNIDIQLPIVANYEGTIVNVSVQSVDDNVHFYAPVFKGVEYSFAEPVADYIAQFHKAVDSQKDTKKSQFSVNCILNYLYCDLEGKQLSDLTGPITFGEVAYQLLNQTAVYLTLEECA
jgi:hypothetical protein